MKTKDVSVDSLFDIVRGKTRYIRDYGLQHPGSYPVYSASLAGPMMQIDSFDHEGPMLVFTNNGYAGTVRILQGPFSLTRDCCALVPRPDVEVPDLRYLRHSVEGVIRPLAVGRRVEGTKNEYTKLTKEMVADAAFPVLWDDSGEMDRAAMKAAGERLERVGSLQRNVAARAADIRECSVLVACEEPYRLVQLDDAELFRTSIGGRVLKAAVTSAGVPVYSANVRQPFGFVEQSVLSDVVHDSLIWGIDGNFDWNLIPSGVDFVATDHCGRLEVLDPRIDSDYLLHELRATKEEYGFDRVYRASLKNIGQVSVRIPVDGQGGYDLARQRELAARHEAISALRSRALETLGILTGVTIAP